MTVCIAAITIDNHIVTVSDTFVSGAVSGADACALKADSFARDWAAMFAADDLTQCLPVIDRARDYFKGRKDTVRVVRSVFKRAYQRHLMETRADSVLGPYGLSMEEFLKSGKRRFTEKIFNSLCERMERIPAAWQFLVYGYDGLGQPHIFTVDECRDSVFDKPGFCAIGSGRWAAEGMLFYLGQNTLMDLPQTIFNACAAKFMAEKVGSVGNDTYLYVKKRGCTMFSCKAGLDDDIRRAWDEGGCPRVPPGILEQISRASMNCY